MIVKKVLFNLIFFYSTIKPNYIKNGLYLIKLGLYVYDKKWGDY